MQTLSDWILIPAAVVLALATVALTWATFSLARHTKVLATLTGELLSVEKKRDERDAAERRRTELRQCLRFVEALRDVAPYEFADHLKAGVIPQPAAQHIRDLSVLAPRYIEDPDTRRYLRELRQWIDVVQTGGNIGENETLIENMFKSVQERVGWSITKWRDELEGSQQS